MRVEIDPLIVGEPILELLKVEMTKMGRPSIELKLQDEVEELKAAYRGSTDAIERRRIQAVWLLAAGKHQDEVRAVTAYARSSLVKILRRYNEAELAGLKDKRHSNAGLAPLLTEEEQQALFAALQTAPKNGVWSGKAVVAWVKQQLGKDIDLARSYDYLKRLGFSLQRPRHAQADDEAQEAFKKYPC